jgi:hypothetical protein
MGLWLEEECKLNRGRQEQRPNLQFRFICRPYEAVFNNRLFLFDTVAT